MFKWFGRRVPANVYERAVEELTSDDRNIEDHILAANSILADMKWIDAHVPTYRYEPTTSLPGADTPTDREVEMLATIQQQNETLEAMQQEIIRLRGIETTAQALFDVAHAAAVNGKPVFKLRKQEDPEMANQIGHAFVDLAHALGAHLPPQVLGDERILH